MDALNSLPLVGYYCSDDTQDSDESAIAPPYSPISVNEESHNYTIKDSSTGELPIDSETELGIEHEEHLVKSTVHMTISVL